MFKTFPSDKISVTKNALLIRELKHKFQLSKSVSWIFHFRFRLVFHKVYRVRIIVQYSLSNIFPSAARVSATQTKISHLRNFTVQLFF